MKTSIIRRRSNRSGFTLFEMLMVLTIIGLLLGLVIYSLQGVPESAQKDAAAANILTLSEALTLYQMENGMLPTTEQGLKALVSKPSSDPVPTRWSAHISDPTALVDPWGHPYLYVNPGKHNPTRYDLYSSGPDGVPDNADDIGNWHDTTTANP
jgi:general secretion pathway protein G